MAGSCFTIAFCRARICMASARLMVTTAGNPSGMMATAIAMQFLKASPGDSPAFRCARQKAMAAITITRALTYRPNISSCTVRLVFMDSCSPTIEPILPISVQSPIDITTPFPWPLWTIVAEKARFLRSPRATLCSPGMMSENFPTGRLSPVSIASSTFRLLHSNMRRSAGTESPPLIKTISPGTRSACNKNQLQFVL